MKRKPIVFVSHPLNGNMKYNREHALKICKKLEQKGYIPICPLLLFSYKEEDTDREEIMRICYKMIDMADIVFIYGDSDGCKKEAGYAKLMGKKVKYCFKRIDYKQMMECNTEVKLKGS